MKKAQGARWGYVLGLLLMVQWVAGPGTALGHGDERGPLPTINVRVLNYSDASDPTLMQGEKRSAEIFRDIGMDIAWVNCNPMTGVTTGDTHCASRVGPLNFDVRIVRDIAIAPEAPRAETMGMAVGNLAIVSFSQVVKEAAAASIDPSNLLGLVMAHELGHILLGSPAHSQWGIMGPPEDYHRAAQDELLFTSQQVELIRRQITAATATPTAQTGAPPDLRITLRVYDYAGLQARLLNRALAAAGIILRDAGLDVAPIICTQAESPAACRQAPDPLNIPVRIVPKPVPGDDYGTLGYASSQYITVNYSRVEKLADRSHVYPDRLLACVLAHELGHVLLGPDAHSATGIMTASFSDKELRMIRTMSIGFLPFQKERMRAYVLAQSQPLGRDAVASKQP